MRRTQSVEIDSRAETIAVDGRERSYTVVVPAAALTPDATLYLVLHGSNQTGAKVRAVAGGSFDAFAGSRDAVVVYPDAYKGLWHDARSSMSSPAKKAGVDDVAFLAELVQRLREEFGTSRVLGAGYSNGGQMIMRVIHEAPGLLAAAGMISATMPTPEIFDAKDSYQPLPVALFHGTRDPIVPYEGGMASLWGMRPRGLGLSAPDTLATLRSETASPPSRRSSTDRPPHREPRSPREDGSRPGTPA